MENRIQVERLTFDQLTINKTREKNAGNPIFQLSICLSRENYPVVTENYILNVVLYI